MLRTLALAGLLTHACVATASCYTVLNASGEPVYRSHTAPVDMSLQLGDTVPEKFGSGALMIISHTELSCRPVESQREGKADVTEKTGLASFILRDMSKP